MGVHPTAPAIELPSVTVPDGPVERMNLRLESEARKQWCAFSRVTLGTGSGAAGNMSVVPMPSFNRVGYTQPGRISTPDGCACLASACAHWRWREAGGTRYEQRSFQSDYPVPAGGEGPVDVEDGWTFDHWDTAAKGRPLPRYWVRRAVEILLPRGCCGLAGLE